LFVLLVLMMMIEKTECFQFLSHTPITPAGNQQEKRRQKEKKEKRHFCYLHFVCFMLCQLPLQ